MLVEESLEEDTPQYWPAGVCKQLNRGTCTRAREDMLLTAVKRLIKVRFCVEAFKSINTWWQRFYNNYCSARWESRALDTGMHKKGGNQMGSEIV